MTEMLVRGQEKHTEKWDAISNIMAEATSLKDLVGLVDLLKI
jgi:hypothetical protein